MLKEPKGPLFTFFGTMRLLKILIFRFFENFKIFSTFSTNWIFKKAQRVPPSTILKTLRFLSLGYGAEFRRSRLVFSFLKF